MTKPGPAPRRPQPNKTKRVLFPHERVSRPGANPFLVAPITGPGDDPTTSISTAPQPHAFRRAELSAQVPPPYDRAEAYPNIPVVRQAMYQG